jgi:hypothetical protein
LFVVFPQGNNRYESPRLRPLDVISIVNFDP